MATFWSKEETLKLISIWGDASIQEQLEGCRRNRDVYTKIANELADAGYTRSMDQCRDKMKKLRGEYKKVKDKRKETGQGRYPEWDYFDAIDGVIGHKPATQPPVVVDSSLNDPIARMDDTIPDTFDQSSSYDSTQFNDNDESQAVSDTTDPITLVPSASSETSETPAGNSTTPPEKEAVNNTRKRKKSKYDVTGDLLDKFISMQEKSDKMMMELENKRAKMEERQMELEAQMRRDEQNFQLQMMNVLTRGNVNPHPSSFQLPYPSYPYPDPYDPDATQDGL